MNVELPDGSVIEDVPDGTSKVDILGKLQRANHPAATMLMKHMANEQTMGDMSGLDKFNAGMGLAFTNIGRAAKQMVGMGSDYAENKDVDSSLMKTGAGAAGNVAGNITAFAPLSVIPGANTVAGAGALGGIVGAFQPADDTIERLKNMGIGGAIGSGTQALAGPVAQRMGEWGADRQAQAAQRQAQGAVGDETLKMGREAGYVLPPSAVNDSFLGRRMESVAGKAAIGQEAAIRNQSVTDRLARQAVGLNENDPISLTNLRSARFDAAQPYRDVAALSPQAANDLAALQQARFDAKMAWKEHGRTGLRSAYADAQRAETDVARLTQNLDNYAQQANMPELVDALKQARQRIAQNHQVQAALNRGTGSVDASVIGRSLDNGAPLSGPLETIGRFQQAYRPYMREGSTIPTPGVSKSEALASALLATGGAASGHPAGLLAGGLPLLSGPTRSLLLSGPVQESVMSPNYSPGLMANTMATLTDPLLRMRLQALTSGMALPMIPAAVK